jgi:SAM-dependent methyltransferase
VNEIEFAEPRRVESPDECFFYHVMDLPGVGLVGEQWDLRPTIDEYLGHFDFQGKRTLDVGAASGFLTFEMEKRGASVVSFDLGETVDWDIVPYQVGLDIEIVAEEKRKSRERLLNAYWLAHQLLDSSARAYYGNIYQLPIDLGPFDVVVLGAILLHLRDPFQALLSASKLSRDALIVTDLTFDSPSPVMKFLPDPRSGSADTWWGISEKCMAAMIQILGFGPPIVTRCEHLTVLGGVDRRMLMSTFVARRSGTEPLLSE